MKNFLFAALTVLSLCMSLVPAHARNFHNGSTVEELGGTTRRQQTGYYGGR